MRRWFATPLAAILLGVALTAWTWLMLGWAAAWRLAVVLAALGVADAALGRYRTPLSWEINRAWHRDPLRYWLWFIGVGVALVLLHLHFTGV